MRKLDFRDMNVCGFWQLSHIHSGQKVQFHGLNQISLIRKLSEKQNCCPWLLPPNRILQNFTVDNPPTTSQAKDKYYKRWRRFWVFPKPVGLQTLSEAGNPGSIMVKFLLLALALGVSCAHHNNPEITPSEVCAFGDERVWCIHIHPEVGLSMFIIRHKIYLHTISKSYL